MRVKMVLCLLAVGLSIGMISNLLNVSGEEKRCKEIVSSPLPPTLWHGSLVGDSPLTVGFYLSEDNYQCHIKRWNWGDNTSDTGMIPAIDHRYSVPCKVWNPKHPICEQWQPKWVFRGYVEEWDSMAKNLLANKSFTVDVNHEDYQIITGFDQRESVINSNDTLQLSVATGNAWSGLTYYWDWGDYNSSFSQTDLYRNPSHKYTVKNDFFCSETVACNNYTGTLVVSSKIMDLSDPVNSIWKDYYPSANVGVSDARTFSVLVLDQSQSHIKPEIEISTKNATSECTEKNRTPCDQRGYVQQTQFRVNELLYFWVYQPNPNRSYHPYGSPSVLSFSTTSNGNQISCPVADPWHLDDNSRGCGIKCGDGYNITCYYYTSPGKRIVNITVQTGDNTYEDLTLPIDIIDPSLSVSTHHGMQGSTVNMNGSGFPPNEVIDLFWDGDVPSGSLVHIGQDGKFKNLSLTIPPLHGGFYNLCARSIPQNINETETYFFIDTPASVLPQVAGNFFDQSKGLLRPNVMATSFSSVYLSWTSVINASNYTVWRSISPDGPFSTIKSGINITAYNDTGLSPYTTPYYVITTGKTLGSSVPVSVDASLRNDCIPSHTEQVSHPPMMMQSQIPIKHG